MQAGRPERADKLLLFPGRDEPLRVAEPAVRCAGASKRSAWFIGAATRSKQLEDVASLPGVKAVAGMPDLHPGKYGPVGCSVLADRIYPLLVGSDIGCGMGLFQLDVAVRKLRVIERDRRRT